WLSVKIGINDLHSYLRDPQTGVSPALFRETYDEVLSRTRAKLDCRLVLIDPFYISTDRSGQSWRSRVLDALGEYIEVVHDLAARYEARLLRTHERFAAQLRYRDPDRFCPEPVHPNVSGHMVIADALYEVLAN
ncbi:MAG TPA: GDSL-type esterase/lipase family protein, partial [Limnochordia bacterium]|nr:GDSL-type esterase/lipase family protein [Limnochordia bacterium]